MSDTQSNREAEIKQLELLQYRITTHGKTLWQLPCSYIAIGMGSASFATSGDIDNYLPYIFGFYAIVGLIIIWCMKGAYQRYKETSSNMNDLEMRLCLRTYTSIDSTHILPYFCLIAAAILGILAFGFKRFLIEAMSVAGIL